MTTLTRKDCTRDNVAVICPYSKLIGFSTNKAKRGDWIVYEQNDCQRAGRVIGRVTCERKTYLEIAVASPDFSAVYICWIEPVRVREIRKAVPRAVFAFFAQDDWKPETVFAQLEYGVSDMRDQLDARNMETA